MIIRPFLFIALTTVIILASGCSRSQAAALISTPLSPISVQKTKPEFSASPIAGLENQVATLQSGNAANILEAQATATPENFSATTPSPTVEPNRQVSPVSDLLYISQDHLMRWDPLTGHAFSLAQNVMDFDASEDGQVIVLLRPQKIAANGVRQFELDALQLNNQQIFNLIDNASQIQQITVSPDGSYVAYTQEQPEGVTIFISPVAPDNQPHILGKCQPEPTAECASLAWSPDSRDLLWSDALGLWQASASSGVKSIEAQHIHPNNIQIKDPKGQNLEIKARFTDLQFAPTERFVLMKVAPLGSQVGWQAVFDRRSGLLAQAADTYVTSEVEAQVKWKTDGNLLVAHASEPGRYIPPFIHIWFVIPTNPELLVSGKQYNLYSDDFPFSTAQSKAVPAHCLQWLSEVQPNHLVFAIQLNQSNDPPVLFDLNLLNGSLTKLQVLPTETTQVLWSPDGINALILGGRNQIYHLSLKTGELTDLQPTIGSGARQFVWMPPALR